MSKLAAPTAIEETDIKASQQAFEELQTELAKINTACIDARDKAVEAKDDKELERVENDLDPRQLVPQKYLEFEKQYRGTPTAFEALIAVVQNACSVGNPACAAAKARIQAVDLLMAHYLRHEGIEKMFEPLNAGSRVPRHDEFLRAVIANNKSSKVQVAALVSKLEHTQSIPLDLEASKYHFPWTVIPQTMNISEWPPQQAAKSAFGRVSCGPLFLDWCIQGYPAVYLIDAQGTLCRQSHLPYLRDALGHDTNELAEALDNMIKQQQP